MSSRADQSGQQPHWLSRGTMGVALASFFSDTGHEMTTSLLPSFIMVTLRSTAGALGLIDGISDALTGLATLIVGPLADDPERRLKMASGGYLATAAATGAIGVAATVWQAGVLRATAWLARGVRSPARDATLASLAPMDAYGRAFGIERAGDNLGAVTGPLLAAALVGLLGIRPTLYLAAIPGIFSAVAITIAAREAKRRGLVGASSGKRHLPRLRLMRESGLPRMLLPIAAFELGNMATTLLILRATGLLHAHGYSVSTSISLAVFIYAAHNLLAAFAAILAGHWSDRHGPRAPFVAAAVAYTGAYLLFGLAGPGWIVLVPAFLLAGSGIGLAEPAESALVAAAVADELRGSGFGLLGGVKSFGDFASSAAVGLLWTAVSPEAGFLYATAWMIIAALASTALAGRRSTAAG